jgi:hypothetical protein
MVRVRLTPASVCLTGLALLIGLVFPSVVSAQNQNPNKGSHWGVRVSFVPAWEMTDSVKNFLFEDNEVGTWKGKEVAIGLARGSTRGGDVGFSFVRKPFDDASGWVQTDQDCSNTICRPHVETTKFQGVYLNAFEVDWFKPFVTIANRAQIGLSVGGGIGSMNGNVLITTDRFEPTGFNQNGPTGFRQIHEEETSLAKDELLPVFPLFKLEAAGAIIVAPALKLQVAGGLNFPAYSFRVGVVYLIGAK